LDQGPPRCRTDGGADPYFPQASSAETAALWRAAVEEPSTAQDNCGRRRCRRPRRWSGGRRDAVIGGPF